MKTRNRITAKLAGALVFIAGAALGWALYWAFSWVFVSISVFQRLG